MKIPKYRNYNDYVFQDGKLFGKFDEMYQFFDDPWKQSMEVSASEKKIALENIKKFKRKRTIELGCGLGYFTNEISKVSSYTAGFDISETAIKKAKLSYPNIDFEECLFSDFKRIKDTNPDCILMSEITWYVIDHLDEFKNFLIKELPDVLFIHLLTLYKNETQKYGAEKFTKLNEIMEYFGLHYYEWGEISTDLDFSRSYFIGSYNPIKNQ